jgi:phosphohistidine phosphatase
MDLVLWRHADAEDGTPDHERALTARGLEQAQRVSKWLRARLPAGVVVLSSPARRAQQTASALTTNFEISAALGTETTPEALIHATGWPKGRQTVLVAGHQPTLGIVAALLLSGSVQSWAIAKGGLIWISGPREKDMQARLRAAIEPDLV